MSISTGVDTFANFRVREVNENPSLAVEYWSTHGHPSTLGGICIAANFVFNSLVSVMCMNYRK